MFALTVFAWMWVRMAETALDASNGGDDFYDTKLQIGRYFMTRVLPGTVSLEAVIKSGAVPMMALSQDAF